MTKESILNEIRRTAESNGGAPLGMRTFASATGIRHADWFGIFWRSWGDAVREAGLQANTLTPRREEDQLLERYATLAKDLGRTPVKGDLLMAKRRDPTFPSETAIIRRFGSYAALRAASLEWCSKNSNFSDVVPFLELTGRAKYTPEESPLSKVATGFVYLLKHGPRSEYKIGRTSNPVRREGELRLELPEQVRPIHYIETDDPAGIEAYWHSRFATKRKAGEWFALTPDDVRAFKKWKRIS